MEKYESLYSKWLYASNQKPYTKGYIEVQVHKHPFHSGLRVLVTDGYKYLKDIHCKNAHQAYCELKKQLNLIKGN